MFECFYTSLVGRKKSKSNENEMFRFLVKHAVKCLHATLTNFNEAAGKSEVEVSEITNRESEKDNCQ